MAVNLAWRAYTQVLRGPVAQWLEQATHNRSVVGSIPTGPTSLIPGVGAGTKWAEGERQSVVINNRQCACNNLRVYKAR